MQPGAVGGNWSFENPETGQHGVHLHALGPCLEPARKTKLAVGDHPG